MNISIKGKEDFSTTTWSGGTTTELFLYPPDGNYGKREFLVRISSATVDLEESVFTRLPGIRRFLAILEGSIRICHKDHYERMLNPYEIEEFSGEWDTTSYGKAVDFNLMLNRGTEGEMISVELNPGSSHELKTEKWDKILVYAPEGSVLISNRKLNPGEAAILEEMEQNSVQVNNPGTAAVKVLICCMSFGEE